MSARIHMRQPPQQPQHRLQKQQHAHRKLPGSGRGRAVLFDLDGVIFHHDEAMNKVSKRASDFISELIRTKHAEEINRRLYKGYGHTIIGLREEYNINMSLQDFNEFIYDSDTLASVCKLPLPMSSAIKAMEARQAIQAVKSAGHRCMVFTNAPKIWVDMALTTTGLLRHFKPEDILSAEDFTHVKPQRQIYVDVSKKLKDLDITFIDDSLLNVANAPAEWDAYLYGGNHTTFPTYIRSVTELFSSED